jgi:hypothetical protein
MPSRSRRPQCCFEYVYLCCLFVFIVQENKNLERHGRNNLFWLKSQLKANIYDFRIATMFGSSLPPVVCRRAHVFFFYVICVCLRIVMCNTYCVVFFLSSSCVLCTLFLWIVHFLIAHSVFSNVYIRLQHDRVHGQCPGSNDYRSVNRR